MYYRRCHIHSIFSNTYLHTRPFFEVFNHSNTHVKQLPLIAKITPKIDDYPAKMINLSPIIKKAAKSPKRRQRMEITQQVWMRGEKKMKKFLGGQGQCTSRLGFWGPRASGSRSAAGSGAASRLIDSQNNLYCDLFRYFGRCFLV